MADIDELAQRIEALERPKEVGDYEEDSDAKQLEE